MKHLTRFTIFTFVVSTVFAPLFFVKTADAHFNYATVTIVTEYCVATLSTGPVTCGRMRYTEYVLYYYSADHVEVLDASNNVVIAHKPGHQNHIQTASWGYTRDEYVYVGSCSQCPT